jgi:PmbA protein
MTAIAGEGTAMERDYDYSSTLHGADLDPPEKVGRSAGERTVERLNPRKVETKRVPVVFDRRVAGSLVSHLASAINGSAIARKTSFLKDKLGQRLFKPGIRVLDDPLRPRGLRSRPFDAEGVAAKRLAVVEDGVLQARPAWRILSAVARSQQSASFGGQRHAGSAHRGPR